MPAEEKTPPVNLTLLAGSPVETGTARRFGDVLSTLSQVFRNPGKGEPPAVLLVEASADNSLRETAQVMADSLHLPLIFADADLAIDEVDGMEVGRIESAGDSLFRRIDETGEGVLVIQDAGNIRPNTGRILERVFGGKPLKLPGMDHPVDFSGWTVVMAAGDKNAVPPDLKSMAGAVIHLAPKP